MLTIVDIVFYVVAMVFGGLGIIMTVQIPKFELVTKLSIRLSGAFLLIYGLLQLIFYFSS